MSKLIVNVETGEETLRELNKAEKDQQKIDETATKAGKAEAEAKAAQRQAIADRLGLTADELTLLLG
jgi:hypothetical protein